MLNITGSFQKRVNMEVEFDQEAKQCTVSTKIKDQNLYLDVWTTMSKQARSQLLAVNEYRPLCQWIEENIVVYEETQNQYSLLRFEEAQSKFEMFKTQNLKKHDMLMKNNSSSRHLLNNSAHRPGTQQSQQKGSSSMNDNQSQLRGSKKRLGKVKSQSSYAFAEPRPPSRHTEVKKDFMLNNPSIVFENQNLYAYYLLHKIELPPKDTKKINRRYSLGSPGLLNMAYLANSSQQSSLDMKLPAYILSPSERERKLQYITNLRLWVLQHKFMGQMNKQEDDEDFIKYEMLYGIRMVRSMKRYTQFKMIQDRKDACENQKQNEKNEITKLFFTELDQKVTMKTRESEKNQQTTKRKYFRQPKIYQQEFYDELWSQGKVKEYYEEVDEVNPEYEILYLFFVEKHEVFLLLGRREREQAHESGGEGESSPVQEITVNESFLDDDSIQKSEADNDTDYFVMINLDAQFLAHLEEPSLVESSEIKTSEDYFLIMQNKVFIEIIRREIEMMFGVQKQQTRLLTDVVQHKIPEAEEALEDEGERQSSSDSIDFEDARHSDKAHQAKLIDQFELIMKETISNFC